jgi:hypothetical protein
VVLNLAVLALLASSGSADPADADRPQPISAPLRVVLLDIATSDLDAREAAVVKNLIAIRLEKNSTLQVVPAPRRASSDASVVPESSAALGAALVGATGVLPPASAVEASGGCASTACLGDVAAQARADFVLLAETASLGDAIVMTIDAYDAAHRRIVRDAISVKERGDLPDRIGALVDTMVAQLINGLPPTRRPDVRARWEQMRIDVCTDARGWFFCDGNKRAVTENDFVRRYRSETNHHDLDAAEIDRDPSLEPWFFMIGGGATAVATVAGSVAIGSTTEGQQFARQSQDAWIVLPVIGLSVSIALIVYGAIELDDAPHVHDGSELDHVLKEDAARQAVQFYDDALLSRLQREAQPG